MLFQFSKYCSTIVSYSMFLDKNTWDISVKKKFGVASFGSLVIWLFSFRKCTWHLLTSPDETTAQMPENITHALKC